MTNAEKFKEVFPNVEVNESQKGFVVLNFKTKYNGYEYGESLAVWNSTWLADYQGEPTIPLSVIEDIKAEIECRRNEIKEVDEKNKTISMKGYVLGLGRALEIIDRKVNSPKTLSSNGEYLESIDRKVNEVGDDCTACKHSDEVDGSSCYECVKGMADNFEVNKVTQ